MNNKDIINCNNKGQYHGYWERYYNNGQLWFKGNYSNNKRIGYWEYYYRDGNLMYKGNFLNDIPHGYWKENFYNINKTIKRYIIL